MRALASLSLAALLAGAALSQDNGTPTAFIAADVHPTVESANSNLNRVSRGPYTGAGRYELKAATLVDMIVSAYGISSDKVVGGPNWLDYDRFDIRAVTPPNATGATAKQMLQALLADRFKLVARKEDQPMPAFDLTVGKGKPKLKESDGGDSGCKSQIQGLPASGAGAELATPISISSLMVGYTCRNMTMEAFAAQMTNQVNDNGGNAPLRDKTGLKGAWDFDFKMSLNIGRLIGAAPGDSMISFPDALEKQLGLKLEAVKVPLPVILVVSANKTPTPNPPEVAKVFPAEPTEFEVATLKPSAPVATDGPRRVAMQFQAGGRVNISGLPVRTLILQAWGINNDMLAGAPKWIDTDRYDITAKAPAASLLVGDLPANAPPAMNPPVDSDAAWAMVRTLLIDRFKITTHMEDRPAVAYDLVAVKPKLKKADPNSRTQWTDGPGADGKGGRSQGRLIAVQNMTMEQFGQKLQIIAGGYIHSKVLDKTGLEGGYDFTFSFSPPGLVNGGGGRGGNLTIMSANGNTTTVALNNGPAGDGNSSDPNGAVSLFEAMEKQLGLKLVETKRPVPVLVIDHIEQKPSDN